MDKNDFEAKNNVRLLPKNKSITMRIIGALLYVFMGSKFMDNFWTTYRLPFQKRSTIAYPLKSVSDPMSPAYRSILEHEVVHSKDFSTAWGLFKMFWFVWLIPLPIFFSGRWYVERKAYLENILHHNYSIDYVVNVLWFQYAWCWPRPLMRKWFLREYKKAKAKEK